MKSLLVVSLLALVACEGPVGPAGDAGADGADGADGSNGSDGSDGADGSDADCFGRAPVDLTGFTGGDGLLYTNDPVDVTVERAGTDALTYSVAGAGMDYVWDGDSFTATATSTMVTSQVFIATDGCTIDTLVWDPSVAEGVFTLDLVHLVPGAGVVGAGVVGSGDATTLDFEERRRLVLPFGEYAFDVRAGGSPIVATDPTTYEPGSSHVLVVHTDGEAISILEMDLGRTPVTGPADFRLVGAHGAAGIGNVDVYDAFSGTLLFDELAYGTSSDLGEVSAIEYGLAVDLDNDGTTDADVGRLDGAAFAGNRVAATAYVDATGLPKVFGVDVDADADVIISTVQEYILEPAATFSDRTPPFSQSVTVAGCPVLGAVNVSTDILHSFRGDLVMNLEAPAGSALLWDEDGGFDEDVIGLFDADSGTDLSGFGDDDLFTRPELADLEGTNGNGAWTLTIEDLYAGDDGLVNSWSLTVECPL